MGNVYLEYGNPRSISSFVCGCLRPTVACVSSCRHLCQLAHDLLTGGPMISYARHIYGRTATVRDRSSGVWLPICCMQAVQTWVREGIPSHSSHSLQLSHASHSSHLLCCTCFILTPAQEANSLNLHRSCSGISSTASYFCSKPILTKIGSQPNITPEGPKVTTSRAKEMEPIRKRRRLNYTKCDQCRKGEICRSSKPKVPTLTGGR